jgi:glycosyltransferase involved in cell wall biosynthesis
MRILMLDNEFPPLGGGMGTVNHALLQCYTRRPDLEIDLITSALGGTREIEQFSDRIRIIKVPVWNKNIHHCTSRELLMYAAQAFVLSLDYHRTRPYEFCFAWSTVPAGAVALAMQKLTSVPYGIWVSGPDIPGFEQRYHLLYPFLSPLIRRVWRKATHVVAKCAGEMRMILAICKDVNVRFIPNGVDLTTFKPDPLSSGDSPLNIVCVARLIERKGQDQLIEAVKRLTDEGLDVMLSLVGTGDAQTRYEDHARRIGIQDRVRFVGYVSREQISACYNQAHVFALPSFNEGMSLAALEAMAAGLPIVVTRTGGTEELVEEGINGFSFDWGDNDQLTNHLRSFAKNRALVGRMGAIARSRAENFGWEKIAADFLDLFNQIASRSIKSNSVVKAEVESKIHKRV